MDALIKKKDQIERRLTKLKSEAAEKEFHASQISSQIRAKAFQYNEKIKVFKTMKNEYKRNQAKFSELKDLVESYKEDNREALKGEYRKEIFNLISKINSIAFTFKVEDFKKFDECKMVLCDRFPNLERMKQSYIKERRYDLKHFLFDKFKETASDKSTFSEMIFYLNFIVKYEKYFEELIFNDLLLSIISDKFSYHFLSDRDSNRLDKPEWVFEFLFHKLQELEIVFKIYKGCVQKADGAQPNYAALVKETEKLINVKINELAECKSSQKRKLVLHFATEFMGFCKSVKEAYAYDISHEDLSCLLNAIQESFVKDELSKIYEMSYVQWFNEYRILCKDSMVYIANYSVLDKDFRLDNLVKPIVLHTAAFIENLRFINREEIRILCFIFSEAEEFKNYMCNEEMDVRMEIEHDITEELTLKSHLRLSKLNAGMLKLIRELALIDTGNAMKKLSYFNYASTETKRNVIVEMHRIVDEYRQCSAYTSVEQVITEEISRFFLDEILLKIRFSSEEYLDLREFYKNVKRPFSSTEWRAEEGFRAVDALFGGTKRPGMFFKAVKKLYSAQ